MRSELFNGESSRKPREIEAVLVDFDGPYTHMDWLFHFCKLRIDTGEHISASISYWDDSLQIGERVRGMTADFAVFTGREHIQRLERAIPPAPPSLLKRLRRMIER